MQQLHGLVQALEAIHYTRALSPGNGRKDSPPNPPNSPRLSSQKTAACKEDALDNGEPYLDSSSLPTVTIDFEEDSDGDRIVPSILVSSDPVSLKATENSDLLNWRHGNIKQENILRFVTDQQDDELGNLKLADLGRAQQHQETKSRRGQGKTSRLFDIWSMGCVMFEAVLWLLYGHGSHNVFLRANGFLTGEKGATPYWRKGKDGSYKLTEAVTGWIDHILEHDLERDGVIGDLIKLTRNRLLKIKLPSNSDIYAEDFHTNSKDLEQQLGRILERARGDENYVFSGADRTSMSLPNLTNSATNKSLRSASSSLLSVEDARE
ncbi:tryptophanyl-tRNA synthetase [Botrytis cinerea]